MGYNNHNAGMHMIWYHRNTYDDLEYYDRLAEKSSRQKEIAMKEPKMKINETLVDDMLKIGDNLAKVKNTSDKRKQKKHYDNQSKREMVIDDKYFKNTIDWYANIYLTAFERKIDIYDDICECERLCKEDIRMSEEHRNILDPLTILDKSIVFLNMLADKIGCDVYEFIYPNAEIRTRRVYRILDKIDDKYCNSILAVCAFEYGVYGEDEDEDYIVERFSLNNYMYLDIDIDLNNLPECHMEYYFNKVISKDKRENPFYTFVVMAKEFDLLSGNNQVFNYMFGGSEIINEKDGRLANFFEKLKKIYFDNGGAKSDHLFDIF